MKRIAPSIYEYKGYVIDGQSAKEIDWTISKDGDWIVSLRTKRDCKEWVDSFWD